MTPQSQSVIFTAFLSLYFLKACYLQGVKIGNTLLFSILKKNRFPVIFGFFPVISPVKVPVIPCYFISNFILKYISNMLLININ